MARRKRLMRVSPMVTTFLTLHLLRNKPNLQRFM
jgi:hypothetical protein